jgi:hypothetical protein
MIRLFGNVNDEFMAGLVSSLLVSLRIFKNEQSMFVWRRWAGKLTARQWTNN